MRSGCDSVQLKSQYNIAGRLGNGLVDFAIERYGTLILVTEAKQNLGQGFAQCGAQLDSVKCINRERRQVSRMVDELKKLYGMVITSRDWIPMCYGDTKARFTVLKQAPLLITTIPSGKFDSQRHVLRNQIEILLSYTTAMLSEAADNRPKAQKTTGD